MSTFAKHPLYSEGPSLTAAHPAPLDIVSGNTQGTHPDNNAFFPALDGLRALAFLMVFGFHYLQMPWGWTGVDIFFVLSGFLITGILFDSCHHPHRIRNFYLRRTLRIFPLYYGVFLLLVILDPIFRWNWALGLSRVACLPRQLVPLSLSLSPPHILAVGQRRAYRECNISQGRALPGHLLSLSVSRSSSTSSGRGLSSGSRTQAADLCLPRLHRGLSGLALHGNPFSAPFHGG